MSLRLNNIRTQILLALLLVSLLPLLLIGGYALQSSTSMLHQHAIEKGGSKLSLVNEQIQMFFQGVQGDMFYLRDSNDVGLYLAALKQGDEATRKLMLANLSNSFRQFSQNRHIYDQVRLIDNDGMEIVRISLNGDTAAIIPEDKLLNKKNRYFVTESLKQPNGGVYISPLDLKEKSPGVLEDPPRPSIRYGTSLFDTDKKQQGMILLNTLGTDVVELVKNAQSASQTLLFVSPEGFYFYHPDATKAWGGPTDLKTCADLVTDYPELKARLGDGSEPSEFQPGERFISTFPVKLNNGQQTTGTLISIAANAVVFAPVWSAFWKYLGMGALILLLSGLVAVRLSRHITRPLDELTEVVERLSLGETDTPVNVPAYDKTQALSAAVERLRKSLNILTRRISK